MARSKSFLYTHTKNSFATYMNGNIHTRMDFTYYFRFSSNNKMKWEEMVGSFRFHKTFGFFLSKNREKFKPKQLSTWMFSYSCYEFNEKKRKSFSWFINSFVLSLAHKNYAARLLLSYPISSTESKSQCRCHFRMYTRNTWNCSIEWFFAFFSVYFKH